jgi:hypothetical protein
MPGRETFPVAGLTDASLGTRHRGGGAMIDDDELRSMTSAERSDLAHRLALLDGPPRDLTPRLQLERRLFTTYILIATIFLIPWTIFLAFTLPRHFLAGRWNAVWVGFDIVLTLWLAITAWAALRRRHVLILAAIVTATLLLVDVWFDVLTASPLNDLLVSLVTGLVGNVPLAVILLLVAYRLDRVSAHHARLLAGDDVTDLPFHRVPIFLVDEPDSTGSSRPSPP